VSRDTTAGAAPPAGGAARDTSAGAARDTTGGAAGVTPTPPGDTTQIGTGAPAPTKAGTVQNDSMVRDSTKKPPMR
jgi:hypothetical protein